MKLAPYNPTPIEVVKVAISILNITEDDVVCDVGCGKGAFLIEAAKSSRKATYVTTRAVCFILSLSPRISESPLHLPLRYIGIEYDESLAKSCIENISKSDLQDRVTVIKKDATKVDFSKFTAMFVYLVPTGLKHIYPKLKQRLLDGCRIVSYTFSIPNLKPVKEISFKAGLKLRLYDRSSCMSTTEETAT